MKHFFTTIALLFSATLFAQIGGKKVKDAIVLFDSIAVAPGDTLHLGSGSDRRGDFVSVYQPANGWLGVEEQNLERKYANKFVIIKHFKKQKDKRTGEKTVAVVNPFGGFNFIADLEQGIQLQEIIAINSRSFAKKETPATVVVQQQGSTADELAKLKKLMDDGVLTKEEFDAQKKKLLEKN